MILQLLQSLPKQLDGSANESLPQTSTAGKQRPAECVHVHIPEDYSYHEGNKLFIEMTTWAHLFPLQDDDNSCQIAQEKPWKTCTFTSIPRQAANYLT